MEQAGTPCPFEGKIGKEAKAAWKRYDKLRPDYDQYVLNLKIIESRNEEIQKEITKDMDEVDAVLPIKKPDIHWQEPK
jgi:hypothetical protein